MFLAFWRADAIVFLVCLVFTSADTIVLTMIPFVFALFLAFSKVNTVVFAIILVYRYLCVHNDFCLFCSDSGILEYRYCFFIIAPIVFTMILAFLSADIVIRQNNSNVFR